MDWCIESHAPSALAAAADQIEGYFRRHAVPADWPEIRRQVVQTMEEAASAGPLLWARVEWDSDDPELIVRALTEATWPAQHAPADLNQLAPGVSLANGAAAALRRVAETRATLTTSRRFELTREAEPDLDATPALLQPEPAELSREAFLTAVALATSAGDSSSDPAARAAQAGAELSVAALAAFLRQTGRARPATAAEAAEAFLELERSAGADFYLIEADNEHAVLGNTRCPFGGGVTAAPMMCRCTSAVLGRLGAEAGGEAWVTMPERIALGDPECRAVLNLGPHQPSGISHRYADPPAGLEPDALAQGERRLGGDPRVVLSLLLPRDSGSVPVVRHMCEQVVGALGASPESIGDLSVALTEACSNVIRHAEAGDDFRVEVELCGDRCEIVVSYRDSGFDPESVGVDAGDPTSESGRGLLLMRALVDDLAFSFDPGHTSVRMSKQLEFTDVRTIQRLLQPKRPT